MSGDLRFGAQKIVLVVVVRVLEKNCDAAAESAADYVLRRVKQPKYETPGTRPNLGGRPLCSGGSSMGLAAAESLRGRQAAPEHSPGLSSSIGRAASQLPC